MKFVVYGSRIGGVKRKKNIYNKYWMSGKNDDIKAKW